MNFVNILIILALCLCTCDGKKKKKKRTTTAPTPKEPFFDVPAQNYCRLKCKRIENNEYIDNVGCECEVEPDNVTLIEDNLFEFRQAIFDKFNTIRNDVASGKTHLPKAADMNVVSYDVEMEFLAHCQVLKERFGAGRQPCRRTITTEFLEFYRNPASDTKPDLTKPQEAVDFLMEMHEYFKDVPAESVDKLQWANEDEHLVNMMLVNARTDKIGCVRAQNPKAGRKNRNMVYCLFGNPGGYFDHLFSEHPLYRQGEPCTHCPYEVKCNTKFTSLCGEFTPVPHYKWKFNTTETGKVHSVKQTPVVLLLALLFNGYQYGVSYFA